MLLIASYSSSSSSPAAVVDSTYWWLYYSLLLFQAVITSPAPFLLLTKRASVCVVLVRTNLSMNQWPTQLRTSENVANIYRSCCRLVATFHKSSTGFMSPLITNLMTTSKRTKCPLQLLCWLVKFVKKLHSFLVITYPIYCRVTDLVNISLVAAIAIIKLVYRTLIIIINNEIGSRCTHLLTTKTLIPVLIWKSLDIIKLIGILLLFWELHSAMTSNDWFGELNCM